jgi:hypothetical protein
MYNNDASDNNATHDNTQGYFILLHQILMKWKFSFLTEQNFSLAKAKNLLNFFFLEKNLNFYLQQQQVTARVQLFSEPFVADFSIKPNEWNDNKGLGVDHKQTKKFSFPNAFFSSYSTETFATCVCVHPIRLKLFFFS